MNIFSNIKYLLNGVDIDSLNKKIADLESSLRKVKDENVKKICEITRLEQKTETLSMELVREQNEVSMVENKLKETQEEIKNKENRISILNEEKVQLQEAFSKVQEESSVLLKKIEELQIIINRSETINTRNIAEIGELKTENERLKIELERKCEEVEQANATLGELTISTKGNESTIENLRAQLDVESKTKDSLMATINALQSKNDILQSQADSLQTSYDNLRSEYENLKNDNRQPFGGEIEVQISQTPIKDNSNESNKSFTDINGNKDVDCDSNVDIVNVRGIDKEKNTLQQDEKNGCSLELTQNGSDSISKINPTFPDEASIGCDVNDVLITGDDASDLKNMEQSSDVALKPSNKHPETLIEDSIEAETETKDENNNGTTVEKDGKSDVSADDAFEDDDDVLDDDSLPYIYDYGLIPAGKLSIPEVYDVKEGKSIKAREFFSQNENELILWRRNLQEEYLTGRARFICPECKQPVKISGHKLARGRVCYFAHFKDSDDCPYKTGTNRTKEEIERQKYSLVQESERHKRLKAAIASALEGEKSRSMGVVNVECEKRINSDIPYLNWRRPDIYAEYNGRRYVFELQLSTTFVSVIVDRDIFYRLNDYNIIWIFNFEDNQEYVNLHNLMCKDIYYANKRNIFIFDNDAEEKSKEKGELVLKCRWLDENGVWSNDKYVTLEMFLYDEETHKPFIVDADKAYLEKFPEYVERRKQLEHSREYLLMALLERQREEEERERKKAEERSNLQQKLLNDGKTVERFRSGTKFGYQYEGTTILPAKYTSAEDIREDGYAQVGFNRKIGLVRKDGKEVVPVEYKNINLINRHGVIMAIYKRVDLWLGDERFVLCDKYNDKEEDIIKEEKDGMTKYILQIKTYDYTYTSSYYGNHPICHKKWTGYSKTTLFSIVEESDSCIIWIGKKIYLLSNNLLSAIDGNYSDIKSVGVDLLYAVEDLDSRLWGIIDQKGNVITDFRFTELIPTGSEFLIAKYTKESTAYGIIDYQGREFAPFQHKILIYLDSERFAFCDESLWGIQDRFGNILHEPEYTYVRLMPSGCLMASTIKHYLQKWEVRNNIPLYKDDNIKLCLLNDKGEIAYTEQSIGEYRIRHSGNLYSIMSLDGKEIIGYSLSYVEFVSESTAIIKDENGIAGLFVHEKFTFFDNSINQQRHQCKNIEHLIEDMFKFEDNYGKYALGNDIGPITQYSYDRIQAIPDSLYFVAYTYSKPLWGYSAKNEYVILNREGNVVSNVFESISEFKDGFAEAVYNGHQGNIDTNGVMQEKVVENYGDYKLCEKFGRYYFRNKENNIASDEYSCVTHLVDMYFSVMMCNEWNVVKLFSLSTKQTSANGFSKVSHLVDDFFVAVSSHDSWLYKGTERFSTESYKSVVLLDNGYIALQKETRTGNIYNLTWKLARKNGMSLNDEEYDSILEANQEYFKVTIDGHEGIIDLDGNVVIEKSPLDGNLVLTNRFADYGLENSDGNVILSLDKHFSSIELTEDGSVKACLNKKYALYNTDGIRITEHEFSSITYETNDRYAVVKDGINGHINSSGNYIESSTIYIAEIRMFIFVVMAKYGLRASNGDIIIPPIYSSIDYLVGKLLAVRKDSLVALFDIEGKQLTEFKYSTISCSEDGFVLATRNEVTGRLDDNGNEIADTVHFNGGYIKHLFGEYSVENDLGEIIIAKGYTKIELLDNSGIFSLYKGSNVAIGNIAKEMTEPIFKSVRPIGNGFFVVSKIVKKIIRERKTGYGYRGNPYTYYNSRTIEEEKYGVINNNFQSVISCKYTSISDFDSEQKILVTDSCNGSKSISLSKLKQNASRISELSRGIEYRANVKAFKAFGIIVKIQGKPFLIHKKQLFKNIRQFKKGDSFVAKYLGNDRNGYPIWKTMAVMQTD